MRGLLSDAYCSGRLSGSGAVVSVSVDGSAPVEAVVGTTALPADSVDGLPAGPWPQPAPITRETRFDVASLTKLFTAAALLCELHERGAEASLPVAEVLPEFHDGPARAVTVRHLLTHTAGFAPEWRADAPTTPDEAWARFRTTRPVAEPGAVHRYSCVGYIWAGLVAEALAGERLDRVIARRVTEPLGLHRTGYRPEASDLSGIAATEIQPGRGLVHGEVHDEAAWALGGISGNAGIFSTAGDLLRFAEALRLGGELDGRRVLPEAVVGAMTTEAVRAPEYGQALGPRIDEAWMGRGRVARIGHTGFTGTSLVTEPGGRRSIVFVTNRVHPSRIGPDMATMRSAVSRAVDEMLGEEP